MDYTQFTLLEHDISEISSAVLSVMGVSMDEMKSDRRMMIDRYPAKVAFCYFMNSRGHGPATIATALGDSRSNIYKMLKRHGRMIYGDVMYKRLFETLKHSLKPIGHE